MASKRPSSTPPPFPDWRATAPPALEEESESAWHKFVALQQAQDRQFNRTATADLQPTEPSPLGPEPSGEPTLDDVLRVARAKNRSCPKPHAWAQLYQLLPVRTSHGRDMGAPKPLEGADWTKSTPMDRRLRLRDQINWAANTGALPAVHAMLAGLREEEWDHF